MRSLTALLVPAALLLCFASTAFAAPSNDDFANREALTGSLPIEVVRSNVGATREFGDELGVEGAGHSVWFDWTATMSGWVTASTCAAALPTVLGVFEVGYLGEHGDKATIGNPSEGPRCFYADKEFTFPAKEGKHYAIGVDGNGFTAGGAPPQTEGSFPLRLEATPDPANDDFADATVLSGHVSEDPDGTRTYLGNTQGNNWNATTESGEPAPPGHHGGASVWWDWTAPATGDVTLSADLGGSLTIQAYTGDAVGSLTPVPSTTPYYQAITLAVEAGRVYRISIDGQFDGAPGEAPETGFSLETSMRLPPGPGYATDGAGEGSSSGKGIPSAPSPTPPDTLLHKPKLKSGGHRVTLTFSSTEPGGSFLCKLDRRPYAPCSSPKTYSALAPGRHVFRVMALNAGGAADPAPAKTRFTIPSGQ